MMSDPNLFSETILAFEKRLEAIEASQKKITEIFDKNTGRLSERLQALEQGTAEKLRRIDVRLDNSEAAQKPPERRWRRLWKFLAAAAGIATACSAPKETATISTESST